MRSLRWRIATWYALLLIVVLVALTLGVTVQFDRILQQQAESHVRRTMQEIERATLPQQNGVFSIADPTGESLQALLASANLAQWSSPNTYIQVDSPQGYVLAKSSNLGPMQFPPSQVQLAPGEPQIRRVNLPIGPFLVEDEVLAAGNQHVIVRVGESMDQLLLAIAQTRKAIAFILCIAVLAVIGLSIVLASQATNPINELSRAMREIRSDRLNRRLKWAHRHDEVGRLAESFDDLLARLEEAFARERRFISDASHELKTPLTSINANAQLLARWGDRDATVRKESLETIINESSALANMVNGMLTLAKAESGDAIPKEPVSLLAVANDAVQSTASRAQDKGLALTLDRDGTAPIVVADPHLLRQMISNLIDNAIKFTERGGVTVRVRPSGLEAVVEVEDSGPGIDEEELALVFDRFYRTDKSRNREVPGTGLGLAIVRSIARIHGGLVEVERAPGGGALFRVRLPCVESAA